MKQQFKLRKNGFVEVKRALLLKLIPLCLLAIGLVLVISCFGPMRESRTITFLLFVTPILLIPFFVGIKKAVKNQKVGFESYLLTFTENEVQKESVGYPNISISHATITSIVKNKKGVFIITGSSKYDVIGVPAQIEHHEQVEQLLSELHPIEGVDKTPVYNRLKWLFLPITIGVFAAVFISTNKLIIGISGATAIMIFVYGFFSVRRNKNIDEKTKKSIWLVWLPVYSIVLLMYYKLTGKF